MSGADKQMRAAFRLLGRAVVALQPYKDDIVLAGGMVPVLYRSHALLKQTELPPILTREADLVIRPRLPPNGRRLISELLGDAGFVLYEAPGSYRNGAGAQYFQDRDAGATKLATSYLELLAPLRGKNRPFVEPQSGLRAQTLRYLDLLAHEPLQLDLQPIEALEIEPPCLVRLPHPVMFIYQKLLARRSGRAPGKQVNDLAHVYDVLLLARRIWPDMATVLQRASMESPDWAKWIRTATGLLTTLFEPTGDGAVDVARIYRAVLGDAAPSERAIAATVQAFASELPPETKPR